MDDRSISFWLIIGAIAGWLAGLIMKGYGFGLLGNIVVGIVGASSSAGSLPTQSGIIDRRLASSAAIIQRGRSAR